MNTNVQGGLEIVAVMAKNEIFNLIHETSLFIFLCIAFNQTRCHLAVDNLIFFSSISHRRSFQFLKMTHNYKVACMESSIKKINMNEDKNHKEHHKSYSACSSFFSYVIFFIYVENLFFQRGRIVMNFLSILREVKSF